MTVPKLWILDAQFFLHSVLSHSSDDVLVHQVFKHPPRWLTCCYNVSRIMHLSKLYSGVGGGKPINFFAIGGFVIPEHVSCSLRRFLARHQQHWSRKGFLSHYRFTIGCDRPPHTQTCRDAHVSPMSVTCGDKGYAVYFIDHHRPCTWSCVGLLRCILLTLKSQHELIIMSILKCSLKLLIHSQTSTVAPLKFG